VGVNSLPETVTRQRRGVDLNPGPSAPESSTLTTRLPVLWSTVWNNSDGGDDDDDECDVYDCADCTGPDLFKCPNVDRCIRATYVCDGREHCDDWTDEMNCCQSYLYLFIFFNYT